ncbi:DUF1801 domain-containing protein [Spongiimicrobium sp. 2-473A-2-J]|uniref:DUF1801 domain-containing protein n=1 Tax=Eudoraea algarum TaxID=3417568 RepID=UPI003D36FBA5
MRYEAATPEEYIEQLPKDRQQVMRKLRSVVLENLPEGFEETMNYGMIGYVVPHSLYPEGYHCSPELPLPFMNLASQKNFIGVYHMGIYSNKSLLDWFVEEYQKQVPTKLDMGKSCIRFKKLETVPYGLIGELCTKIKVQDWINFYENAIKNRKK